MSTCRLCARPSSVSFAIHRIRIRIAGDSEACPRYPEAARKDLEHRDASRRGKLPVAAEPFGVNRKRIGIALPDE